MWHRFVRGSLLILHFFSWLKHLSDLRRCLSTSVVTTAFKFGERVAFEFFQRFLAQRHNPKLGQPCTIGCVGHHKKPENIGLSPRPGLPNFCCSHARNTTADIDTTAELLGASRLRLIDRSRVFGGGDARTTSPLRHTNQHQAVCLPALQTVCASVVPACAATCGPRRRDAHFRV